MAKVTHGRLKLKNIEERKKLGRIGTSSSSVSRAEIEEGKVNELCRIALIHSFVQPSFSIIFKQIRVLNFISPCEVPLRLLLEHFLKC